MDQLCRKGGNVNAYPRFISTWLVSIVVMIVALNQHTYSWYRYTYYSQFTIAHGPADVCYQVCDFWPEFAVCLCDDEFRKWLLWVNVLTILEDAEVNQRAVGHEGRGLYRRWIEAALPHYWQRSILWCPFWEHPPFNRRILLHDCLRPFVCNNRRFLNAAPLTLTGDICCRIFHCQGCRAGPHDARTGSKQHVLKGLYL